MRNARRQQKYHANRSEHGWSIAQQLKSLMKNSLLYTTLIVGLALTGCNKSTRQSTAADTNRDGVTTPTERAAADTRATTDAVAQDVRNAGQKASDNVRSGVNTASNAISNAAGSVVNAARMTEWKLNTSDIQADIDAKREIVRTKTAAATPTGNMDKSTLKAAVEGRIKADPELSGYKLDVDPGSNGDINLDGKVASPAQVGKAIALALDTDGVMRVKSKIQVDKDAMPKNR
jgi:hypothetical protein